MPDPKIPRNTHSWKRYWQTISRTRYIHPCFEIFLVNICESIFLLKNSFAGPSTLSHIIRVCTFWQEKWVKARRGERIKHGPGWLQNIYVSFHFAFRIVTKNAYITRVQFKSCVICPSDPTSRYGPSNDHRAVSREWIKEVL